MSVVTPELINYFLMGHRDLSSRICGLEIDPEFLNQDGNLKQGLTEPVVEFVAGALSGPDSFGTGKLRDLLYELPEYGADELLACIRDIAVAKFRAEQATL